jgi:hypothetical protein
MKLFVATNGTVQAVHSDPGQALLLGLGGQMQVARASEVEPLATPLGWQWDLRFVGGFRPEGLARFSETFGSRQQALWWEQQALEGWLRGDLSTPEEIPRCQPSS